MAELILPAVQLAEPAWRNVVAALRLHQDDAHLLACADVIEEQMDRLCNHFGSDDTSGEVRFKVTATLRGQAELKE